MARMPDEVVSDIVKICFDEKTGEVKIFAACLSAGACPTQIFLDLQKACREEGLELDPLPGKGPYDFSFQLAAFNRRNKKERRRRDV